MNDGLHRPLAYGLALGLAALAAIACLAVGNRRGGQAAFVLSLACSLLATPISWLHYFALLVIPLAIVRPRLSPLWLLPLVLQFPTVGPNTVQTIIMFALVATISALAVVPEGRTRADPPSAQLGKPEPSGDRQRPVCLVDATHPEKVTGQVAFPG